jgi:tRNA nucleotidyltransferase (CCA-adding enzyme)
LRLDGPHYAELHDYWGGLNDLKGGLVRVLHSLSFVDDPTRMLRAVRFEQRFGFKIEDRTLELIEEALPLLERVSGDRIRHELDRILEENQASSMLTRLDQLNLLTAIQPYLDWDDWISTGVQSLAELDPEPDWRLELSGTILKVSLGYILWLIRLTKPRVRKVIRRLKISTTLVDKILSAHSLWRDIHTLTSAKPSKIATRLDDVMPLAIYANYIAAQDEQQRKLLWEYVSNWRHVSPNTNGHVLRQRGLPPGPIYRKILTTLRNAWLDGKIVTAEQEEALLEQLLAEK